jgi:two-component system CheB/CheR fusion protein
MSAQAIDERTINRAKIDSVVSKLSLLVLLELLAATLLFNFVVLFARNYSSLTFLWLSFTVMASVARILVVKNYIDKPDFQDNYRLKSCLIYISIAASALVWGTTWVMMDLGSMEPPRGALILWPCAMMAFVASNISAKKSYFFAFSVPIVLLHIAVILPNGGDLGLRYSFGFVCVLLFSTILAMRAHKEINEFICLTLSNKALQKSLEEEERKLEEQSKTLLSHIERERELLEEKQKSDHQLAMANEEKLQLLDSVGEGIFGTNSMGRLTFVNSMALKLLGYSEKEVLGEDILDLLCKTDGKEGPVADTRKAILNCFHGQQAVSSMKGQFQGNNKDILPVTFSCQPIYQDGILIGTVISFFDISEQLNMESKLLRAQKMEAIGRITGGVAHDFNNLLTVLQGNLQFLRKRITQRDQDNSTGELDLIENMLTATRSGAELNNRLLTYSREQSLESTALQVNDILEDMNRFVGRVLGEDIVLELDLCDPEPTVMLDRAQFENVILNLCMNARDAMPNGGKLLFRSRVVELAEDPHRLSGLPAGQYVELAITDSGTGIRPEIQEKIFDPFFTTKPDGAGSGFGLSTAYGFMQQSGGSISVRSRLGEGATFILHIPVLEGAQLSNGDETETTIDDKTYQGTLLVVEDDNQVRDIASMALMEAGYKVILAENGQTGLEKLEATPGIDLVFSDIIMPGGMTGIEMAQKILSQRPGMKILLATGYTDKTLKDSVLGNENILCISKPYDFNELPELIDSLINTAA